MGAKVRSTDGDLEVGLATRISWSIFLALGLSLGLVAQPSSAQTLPSPRDSRWVVDQAGLLSSEDREILAQLGDQVHAQQGAELAVVTVRSTHGKDHRSFATQLFNTWRLGDTQRDNGLLIFVAIDDRAAEIILGDGIDSDAEVAKSDRIMQNELVARFRRGDPAGAIVAGARACARDFFGIQPPPLEGQSIAQFAETGPQEPVPAWAWAITCLVPAAGLGGLGALIYWLVSRFSRKRPRNCPNCSQLMTLLDETADDAHLSSGEQAEERLDTVDYDVWLCQSCGTVEKRRHGKWFTGYSKCPQCQAVAAVNTSTTLRSATTSSTGLAEIHESCKHCGRENTYRRSIPRVSRSSSSSGGGGSSSGRGSSGRW